MGMSYENVPNQDRSLERYLETIQSGRIAIADLRSRALPPANHFDGVVEKAGLSSSLPPGSVTLSWLGRVVVRVQSKPTTIFQESRKT
jgi:hypothetical protein